MSYKECNTCAQILPIEMFHRNKAMKSGRINRCKHCCNEMSRRYHQDHRENRIEQMREYRNQHPDVVKQSTASWRSRNRDKFLEMQRTWRQKNFERRRAYQYDRYHNKKKNDPMYLEESKIRGCMSQMMSAIVSGRLSYSNKLVPYDAYDLKLRLEAQFKSGMSWSNYGSWEMDHKIPISVFLSKGEHRIDTINALCNIQPLWAVDNYKKGSTLPHAS